SLIARTIGDLHKMKLLRFLVGIESKAVVATVDIQNFKRLLTTDDHLLGDWHACFDVTQDQRLGSYRNLGDNATSYEQRNSLAVSPAIVGHNRQLVLNKTNRHIVFEPHDQVVTHLTVGTGNLFHFHFEIVVVV